jgi:cell shape-determining protein MreC
MKLRVQIYCEQYKKNKEFIFLPMISLLVVRLLLTHVQVFLQIHQILSLLLYLFQFPSTKYKSKFEISSNLTKK